MNNIVFANRCQGRCYIRTWRAAAAALLTASFLVRLLSRDLHLESWSCRPKAVRPAGRLRWTVQYWGRISALGSG